MTEQRHQGRFSPRSPAEIQSGKGRCEEGPSAFTLGNIVGGAGIVGTAYGAIYEEGPGAPSS